MAEKCGRCGSANLGPDDWDVWHYIKVCRDCGARTRYKRNGEIVWVKGDEDRSWGLSYFHSSES